jgi:Domain of unknown function (DUF932)
MRTINAPRARFDSNLVLDEDALRKIVPSVFATTAHESRSAKFVPVPTIEILRSLRNEGFEVVGARQGNCKLPGKSAFTKHQLRLRQMNNLLAYKVGDTIAEVMLRNANDGTAKYDLAALLFRIACLNGMSVTLGTIDDVKVSHIGKNVRDDVIEGTFTVVKQAQLALAAPREWSQIILDRDERKVLAEAVRELRFADDNGEIKTPITAEQLLVPRRREDTNPDLWTVTNVLQEHVVRGGDTAYGRDANNRMRRVTTRSVNGIDSDVKLNRALFTLADKMAALKGAKPLTAQPVHDYDAEIMAA